MPSVADMVSAMYMRCIHAGVRSRLGEPNLLAWYQIYGNADAYLRDVYAMTGWAWESSCGSVVPLAPWYRSSQPLVLFALILYPLTS